MSRLADLETRVDDGVLWVTLNRPHVFNALTGEMADQLAALLRERGIDRVTVAGLATDYCVRATALDALREGFAVTLDTAGSRGIEAKPGDIERALDEVRAAGGEVR